MSDCQCNGLTHLTDGKAAWSTCTACRVIHEVPGCPHKIGKGDICQHCEMPMTARALNRLLAS